MALSVPRGHSLPNFVFLFFLVTFHCFLLVLSPSGMVLLVFLVTFHVFLLIVAQIDRLVGALPGWLGGCLSWLAGWLAVLAGCPGWARCPGWLAVLAGSGDYLCTEEKFYVLRI